MRDPHARTGAHDGLERRHHAARRHLHHGAMIRVEIVDVGLAVRHDDDLRRIQVIAHHLLQRLRRPVLAKIDFQALLLLRLGQHLAHLRQNGQRGARRLRVVQKRLPRMSPISTFTQRRNCSHATSTTSSASKSTEMPMNTSTKSRAVRCRGRRSSSHAASARETAWAAPSKSKRDTCTDPDGSCTTRGSPRAPRALASQDMAGGRALGLENRRAVGAADQDAEQALVGGDLGQVTAQRRLVALFHQIRDRLLHGMHDELRAQLDVGAKPFRQQALDVGQARNKRRRRMPKPPAARNIMRSITQGRKTECTSKHSRVPRTTYL
jgi:hypothetical protein